MPQPPSHLALCHFALAPGSEGIVSPFRPYLSCKAHINGFEPRFIDLATQVNNAMPRHVVSVLGELLNLRQQCLNGSAIFLIGVSYKRDANDARESPAIEILSEWWKRGANVSYHDPYVPSIDVEGKSIASSTLDNEILKGSDIVLIVTDHSGINYARIVELASAVVDTQNATHSVARHRDKVVRL
jgi:UDP-N-acetyl-D-glucosamine dehydrogenase